MTTDPTSPFERRMKQGLERMRAGIGRSETT
jgi:hypothetical protein